MSLFDFGIPDLPVTSEQKEWIEESLLWLLNQFGKDYFLSRPMILPEPSFFPDKYKSDEASVDKVVTRVCGYMDVDPETIEIHFFSDGEDLAAKHHTGTPQSKAGAAGLYYHPTDKRPRAAIAINDSNLKNPISLVATIAHELGHVILLGGGRISRDNKDHEYLTDLITVFLGLGIFSANAAFQFHQWTGHSHQGWRASRAGYLSEEMFAYALAGCAWMRNESKPAWSKYLAMNVGAHFKTCHKYLFKSGQTTLPNLKS